MRHTRLSLVLIALALVVAACNQDSDDTTTTAASTPSETTTTVTTTADSTTTTTEAATETTTEPETPRPLPELNPPTAENALSVEVLSDWSAFRGIDRCKWTPTGNPEQWDDLWANCRDAAEAAADHFNASADEIEDNNATIVESFGWTEASAMVREPPAKSADHLCFIEENEIVTTATEDDVEEVLLVALDVKPEDVSPSSEFGELPMGLLAFEIEGADPVDATSALVDAGIPASPRYMFVPSPAWAFGPGGPALPADPDVMSAQNTVLGNGDPPIAITVIDTRSGTAQPPEPTGLSPALAGHSQFVAGIITRLLPGENTNVVERSALPEDGNASLLANEHRIVKEINKAIAGELSEGGVINLSLGTYACRPDHFPLELAAKLGEMAAEGLNIAVVAAAGNDSHVTDDAPFWPAGFSDPSLVSAVFPPAVDPPGSPGAVDPPDEGWSKLTQENLDRLSTAITRLVTGTNVIGVGALVHSGDEDGWLPADFSNQVAATVWAPGANIVSNHPEWAGYAQWDGTSFAAPHVAALIASCVDLGDPRGYRNALTQLAEYGNCSQ